MDICSRISFPVADVSSLHGFCPNTRGSSYGDRLRDELAYNIQVDVKRVSVSIPLHKKDVNRIKNECLESHQSEVINEAHEDDADVIINEAIAHDDDAKSLQERLKPVSAMKGSREKHGLIPAKQLTVKWAPDVYDPVPASSLHMVINRPNKHNGKKKSKSKQKNKRGSKGKDKKQAG